MTYIYLPSINVFRLDGRVRTILRRKFGEIYANRMIPPTRQFEIKRLTVARPLIHIHASKDSLDYHVEKKGKT